MRVILVPVADRPECTRALQTAFDIGSRVGASVLGCHVRPHRDSEVALSPGFPDAVWRRKCTRQAPAAARALFQEIAQQSGYKIFRRPRAEPGAYWSERVGTPERILEIVGPLADLIVVSRPAKPRSVADAFMQAALLHSSRPVLLLPPKNRRIVGRRVVIAWNQGADVARAVTASIPLLRLARSISIVTCGPEDRPAPKSAQLADYLACWGIDAVRVARPGKRVENGLLAACRDVRADLIVSGAYSRSRWREQVFGGTTEFLVRKARMPVLMQHR